MPLFIGKAESKGIEVLVRARCLSCARDVLAANAGAEGTLVWRDRTLSTVELVQEGKQAVLIRAEKQ